MPPFDCFSETCIRVHVNISIPRDYALISQYANGIVCLSGGSRNFRYDPFDPQFLDKLLLDLG